MTAFALISGALFRAPELKTAKTGKAYVAASLRVTADNATDYWSVLAFSESAQAELSRLGEGDKISAQGSFKVEPYTARDGQTRINRTIFADHILALRQPPRERKPKAAPTRAPDDGAPSNQNDGRDFSDDIPF
jgi:single-stranded DNA-binding protein